MYGVGFRSLEAGLPLENRIATKRVPERNPAGRRAGVSLRGDALKLGTLDGRRNPAVEKEAGHGQRTRASGEGVAGETPAYGGAYLRRYGGCPLGRRRE